MQHNRTEDNEIQLNIALVGVVIQKGVATPFLSTKFAVFLQTAIVQTRAPPHFDLISQNFKSEVKKVAFNKAKEEYKWKQWKEQEEKILRKEGVDENVIAELRKADWENFKSERRYREHQMGAPDCLAFQMVEMPEPEVQSISELLDQIDNEQLLHILVASDRKTLQIILLKMMGYSVGEISVTTGISEKGIYCRMDRLKKKIKKIL